MKNLNKFLLAGMFISVIGISYNYGKIKGLEFAEGNTNYYTANNIANRYIKSFGNPKTQEQQCRFDYVVYNDSTECN